jgi:ribosomal protection tetracycline resistance protein
VKSLNLGIVAHVDAGKTSLTERLLYTTGVIDEVGSVDGGNTQTDTLALEQQRGITIRSAVVSFTIDDTTVNLIDTPGHPDFIAEVDRVLSLLDGAVLVVSAVEGVQAQTRVLLRALQRLHIPALIFVNKIDRAGATPEAVFRQVRDRLAPVAISMGTVSEPGIRRAAFVPHGRADADLARQTRAGLACPVFFGSAITGAGLEELVAGVAELLPTTDGDVDGAVSGTVFKVERGAAGEKVAYVALVSGSIRVRDRLRLVGRDEAKVTAIRVFAAGAAVARACVVAGQIAKVWGLAPVQVGDVIGVPPAGSAAQHFSRPTLETVVDPCRPHERGALHAALTQLAEQDPLIDLRQDDVRRELSLSLYGEVQKEVVQATLADDYGVDVTFRTTTTICVERLVGSGTATELLGVEPNPFLATVGLRLDPAPVGSGIEFRLEVERGSMPPAFFLAVEQTVAETLRQGLHGWEITDCTVTMTHSGYAARQSHSHGSFDASMSSTAGDFRNLTPLVLTSALQQAGTVVTEPIHRFELEIPAETLGATLRALAQVRGVPLGTEPQGSSFLLRGDIPAARVHDLRRLLPTLTRGEGVLVSAFAHYRPVSGPVLERPRTDNNPLDRRGYLLRVPR